MYHNRYEFSMWDWLTVCEDEFTHLDGRCRGTTTDSFRLVIPEGGKRLTLKDEIKAALSGL